MYAAENIFSVTDVSLDKSYMVLSVKLVHIAKRTKFSVFGWKFRICNKFYKIVMALAIFFQRLYSNEFQSPFLSLFLKFLCSHHSSVISHDLTAESALL